MPSHELPAEPIELCVGAEHAGWRLDVFLVERFSDHSRAQVRRAIQAGGVVLDGHAAKPSARLRVGQRLRVHLPEIRRETPQPENIPLDILFEDDDLVAVNKPAGMIVHPAKGHWSGTLAAALAYHFEQLSSVGGATRPGIVHRLDRDTSGVIVVAKNDRAHMLLAEQFRDRTATKQYLALVQGVPDRDRDQIDQPIATHPKHRERMAIRAGHPTSRDATTVYEVIQRFERFALVRAFPRTGRTHQIRVHLRHIGCPVLCDPLYSGRSQISRGELRGARDDPEVLLSRTALHAHRLRVALPSTGQPMEWTAPLAADIEGVLAELKRL